MDSTPAARSALDIADDTFVVADRAAVAALVGDPASWEIWWPDLALTVTEERGLKGMRWAVDGPLQGSMEIWLEPWGDGVVVHWYLRAASARVVRRPDRDRSQRVLRWKQHAYALKGRFEAGREPGSPRTGSGAAGVKEVAEPAEST